MKNIITLIMLTLFCSSASYAGDCANGQCGYGRSVRKVVNVTRNIVSAPLNVGKNVVVRTRDVFKNQPIRNRIVNRSTVVVE